MQGCLKKPLIRLKKGNLILPLCLAEVGKGLAGMDCVTTGLSFKAGRCSMGNKQHCGTVKSLRSSRNSSAQRDTRSKSVSHHPMFLMPPGSTYFVTCPQAPFLCFMATQLHQKGHVSSECSSKLEG